MHAGKPALSSHATGLAGAAGVGVATFAMAFGAAPHACEGGLTFYFWFGVAAMLALAALPWVVQREQSVPIRLAWSAGFASFAAAMWIAGLFVANLRIICRLF